MTFGQNLRRLRLAAQLTQMGLARALGYTQQSSISEWERTDKLPTPDVIIRVAEALHCTPSDLLEGVETAYDRLRGAVTAATVRHEALTNDQREWFDLWPRVTPKMRRHIRGIMQESAKKSRP